MDLSRSVSQINDDICQYSQFLHTPVHLTPTLSGFALESYNGGVGNAPIRWWKFDDECIRLDTISHRDGWTDRQTEMVKQYR